MVEMTEIDLVSGRLGGFPLPHPNPSPKYRRGAYRILTATSLSLPRRGTEGEVR